MKIFKYSNIQINKKINKYLNFNIKLFRHLGIYFAIGIFGYLAIAKQSFAQEFQRTYTVVPPTLEKTVSPGDKVEGLMKVINDSDAPVTFKSVVQDYIVESNNGVPTFLPEGTFSKNYSAASWIAAAPDTFTVIAHKQQILTYYIQVPPTARPGGHYAAIIFKPIISSTNNNTGAAVSTQVGTLFYISVKGPINEFVKITNFFAKNFQEYGPITINSSILNLGDLHVKPNGAIRIFDTFGNNAYNSPLEEHNIFPGASRNYSNTIGTKWMIGRFKATFFGSYGVNNNIPLGATIYFWVLPWKILTIAIFVIIAIILATMLYIKKNKKDTDEESETPAKS